jgi:hypothetical protein
MIIKLEYVTRKVMNETPSTIPNNLHNTASNPTIGLNKINSLGFKLNTEIIPPVNSENNNLIVSNIFK